MAKRKMPARYKTGPKKGQFKPKGAKTKSRRNAPKKSHKGGRRVTARRAYMKSNPPKRRKARRNTPTNKEIMSVILWASVTAFAQGYVKNTIGAATGSPMAASYGTVAAVGGLGWYLTKKVKTRPAGYAVLGVAFAQLAQSLGAATGLFPESGAGFVSKSKVMQRLPKRVSIPSMNPVGRIVVPA